MKNKIKEFIIKHLMILDVMIIVVCIGMFVTKDYSEAQMCLNLFILRCVIDIVKTIFNNRIDKREDLTDRQKYFAKIGNKRMFPFNY